VKQGHGSGILGGRVWSIYRGWEVYMESEVFRGGGKSIRGMER